MKDQLYQYENEVVRKMHMVYSSALGHRLKLSALAES